MSKPTIALAQLDDVPALNKLVNAAYRGDSAKRGWTHEADLLGGIRTDERQLKNLIESSDNTLLKATWEDELIGCVNLADKGNYLYLGMLTVYPTRQNDGIGRELLLAAEDWARRMGKEKIEMTVISKRSELIAYYERKGYKNTGEKRPFPMNDPDFGEPKEFLEFVVLEKKV